MGISPANESGRWYFRENVGLIACATEIPWGEPGSGLLGLELSASPSLEVSGPTPPRP